MAVQVFENDDVAYLDWLSENRRGFVVNGRRRFDPDYLVLHRVACATINVYPGMDRKPGGFTERAYVKYCGESREELEEFLRGLSGNRHSFSKECGRCNPN